MKITTISKAALLSTFVVSLQGCTTQGDAISSNTPLSIVKQILLSATQQGFSVLGDNNSFLTNALIDSVMPEKLKSINSKLEGLGLSSLVEKEKQYIAKGAQASVSIAQPIINSAIQEMTVTDAINIVAGGKGAATEFLKTKTKDKLIAVIQPQVENQLNSNGLSSLIDKATKGSNIVNAIGGLLGNKQQVNGTGISSSIGEYASEHIVNGLFEVVKDYEVKNSNTGGNILNSILGGSSK